jgi:hypothetical protein
MIYNEIICQSNHFQVKNLLKSHDMFHILCEVNKLNARAQHFTLCEQFASPIFSS